jgi:hypothetical protein
MIFGLVNHFRPNATPGSRGLVNHFRPNATPGSRGSVNHFRPNATPGSRGSVNHFRPNATPGADGLSLSLGLGVALGSTFSVRLVKSLSNAAPLQGWLKIQNRKSNQADVRFA